MPANTFWRTAVYAALQNEQMEVLEWLHKNNRIDINDGDLIAFATLSGNIDVLIWLQNRYLINWNWDLAMHRAIEIGNLNVIKYIDKYVEISALHCESAVEFGDFEIIKWLYENQCEWNFHYSSTIIESAVKKGNLSVLQWLIEKKCPIPTLITFYAVEGRNLQLIEWLDSFVVDLKWTYTKLCSTAVATSSWDITKWLFAKNCLVEKGTLVKATKKGASLDILQHLFNTGPDRDRKAICQTAGSYGRLDFVKWVSEGGDDVRNIAWASSYYGAIKENRLDFLKEAYSNYCVCVERIPDVEFVVPPLYTWLKKCIE